jgi:hypothetical protein
VLTINGYDKSRGIARELQAAQEYGRHVRFYSLEGPTRILLGYEGKP